MSSQDDNNTLHYSLLPNHLVKNKKVKRAVVHSVFYIKQECLIQEVSEATGLPEDSVRNVMSAMCQSISTHSQNGHGFQTDLFESKPIIKGVVQEHQRAITYPDQRVEFKVQFGEGIQLNYEAIKCKQVKQKQHFIAINSIEDGVSQTQGKVLTCYGHVSINGDNLRFNPDKTDEGVFIVAKSGEEVRVSNIFVNSRKVIQLCLPKLPLGNGYRVELRKRFFHNNNLFTKVSTCVFTVVPIK